MFQDQNPRVFGVNFIPNNIRFIFMTRSLFGKVLIIESYFDEEFEIITKPTVENIYIYIYIYQHYMIVLNNITHSSGMEEDEKRLMMDASGTSQMQQKYCHQRKMTIIVGQRMSN
jgi:hypothetical protein